VSTCLSIVAGLRELGISRIALFDPPWFDAELTGLGRDIYADQGFEVVYAAPCALPSAQNAIRPADLFDQIGAHTPDSADAVVVGGNGFRAAGVIDAVEHALGRPMLTPNQALPWGTLRPAGAGAAVPAYGRLLEERVRAGS
jgi:maleate isomerase